MTIINYIAVASMLFVMIWSLKELFFNPNNDFAKHQDYNKPLTWAILGVGVLLMLVGASYVIRIGF